MTNICDRLRASISITFHCHLKIIEKNISNNIYGNVIKHDFEKFLYREKFNAYFVGIEKAKNFCD